MTDPLSYCKKACELLDGLFPTSIFRTAAKIGIPLLGLTMTGISFGEGSVQPMYGVHHEPQPEDAAELEAWCDRQMELRPNEQLMASCRCLLFEASGGDACLRELCQSIVQNEESLQEKLAVYEQCAGTPLTWPPPRTDEEALAVDQEDSSSPEQDHSSEEDRETSAEHPEEGRVRNAGCRGR